MELNNFTQNFVNSFDETPNNIEINGNTNFKDLDGWDSLTALSIMAMIDDEYGISITGDEIKKSNTINDLFEIVKNKKG
jgi:acyl carrier protein